MTNATEYRASANVPSRGVSGIIAGLRFSMVRRKVYNETMNELLDLTDRELNDLGLGRGDLKRIALEAANEQLA